VWLCRRLVHKAFTPRLVETMLERVEVGAGDSTQQLSEDELVAMVFLLLVAGHETTVNLMETRRSPSS
jgi:cytochrome P450